ncbi:MAG: hypothetical protein PVH87_09910 [Desulfobacteraceae bacterium]|jgi:serine/threonine protein kinase
MNRIYQLIVGAIITIALFGILDNRVPGPHALAAVDQSDVSQRAHENGASSGEEAKRPTFYEQFKTTAQSILSRLGIDYEFAKLYATWIVGAPTLVVFVIIAIILRPRKKKKTPVAIHRPIQLAPQRKRRSRVIDIKKPPPTSDKERVLEFFFQLFKQQVGALPDAPTELTLIESRPSCPNDTYEMRVKLENNWAARRMSIGLLGQGGGSRSKCFYVIYDSHMVLKIPSKPIPEFSTYREKIKAEAKIVECLYPRECIVPRISVILKAIHSIPGSEKLSEDMQEDKYVHFLEVKPEFQEYLKIGSSFAFFMDLAKHFFLSSTLEEIHRSDQRIVNEAMKQHELFWDRHGFVSRYGEEAGPVCHDLQDAYYRCEGRLRQLVDEANIIEDIPTFQLKQWFLTHLAGEKVDAGTEDLSEDLIERVNRLLYKVVRENHQQVEHYRTSVYEYVKEMRFSQHRTQLENLSSNTLNMLAWIDEKGVSLRDLKPENLFVAGQPEAYPIFLNDAKKFTIGLIDVETAVVMGAKASEEIPQPQLAGTPLYATPSHLLSNTVLYEVYGDVRIILHMQDWYATIAIIYKIITGKNLFSSTALVFPDLLRQIKMMDPAGPDMDKDVASINKTFWSSAIAEFNQAIAADRDIFERIEVAVPRSIIPNLVKALHSVSDRITTSLVKTVSQQSVFTGRDKCQFLLDATVEKIGLMKKKLSQEKPGSIQRNRQREKALAVLDRIEVKKKRLQRKLEAAAALKAIVGTISADQLLEAMFEQVFTHMYLTHWPAVEPKKWKGRADVAVDVTTYQATM